MGLALDANLKFCTSVAKGAKLKVRKFWEPSLRFVEVTGEKLNRVNTVTINFIIIALL